MRDRFFPLPSLSLFLPEFQIMEARCFAGLGGPPNPMGQLAPIGVPVELRETRFP